MKTGKTLQELAVELDRQNTAKKDLAVETGALHMFGGEGASVLSIGQNTKTTLFN